MALDPTARESNIRDSIKKYFVDNLYSTEGIELSFDKSLSTPKIQGHEVNRWVMISFEIVMIDDLSDITISIYCCTRKDSEGFRLAQLSDTVYGYLIDTDQTDSMRRITFYRSRSTGAWTNIGGLVIQKIIPSSQMETEDQTKFKILTCRIRTASKA